MTLFIAHYRYVGYENCDILQGIQKIVAKQQAYAVPRKQGFGGEWWKNWCTSGCVYRRPWVCTRQKGM